MNGKKITFLGWAFKKDTNDTRESAAIYVADSLIEDGAIIHVYDPMVQEFKIKNDLSELWIYKGYSDNLIKNKLKQVKVHSNHINACNNSHGISCNY